MNINALRDDDNDPGFYAVATSAAKSWPGATMYQSSDSGSSYQVVTTFTNRATMGRTLGALGDYEGGNTVDEINSVVVKLTYGTLASVPYEGLLEGAQAALIGDEVVYFRDAVLNGAGLYTLRGLLRGRRGTEWAMNTHATGDRFVLLTPATVKPIPQVTSDIGKTRLYKMVTSGAFLSSATPQSFTNLGARLKPYAPVLIGGGSDADGNLTINWTRRTRISGEWKDGLEVPLGEASEAYEVEIMDATFSTVKRTISGLTSPTAIYSAADLAADGIASGDPVYIQVYQLSSTVGRGYPGRGALRHTGRIASGGGSGGGSSSGPVAPVLTSPAGSQTGSTSASGSVSTNQIGGTLFALPSTSSTATKDQVKAGLSQGVTATGPQYVNVTGLTPDTTYYLHFLHRNSSGLESMVVTSASFRTDALAGGGTPAAPILTTPTSTKTGPSTATGTVSTDTATGTLYALFSTNANPADTAVKAGKTQAVSATGVQNVSITGLTPDTVYYPSYLHRSAVGLDSAVVTGPSFRTDATSSGGGGSTATVNYTTNTAAVTNPERGFYVHVLHGGDFSSGNLNPYKAQNMSIVLYQAYLTAYKNAALDSTFLNAFQANLNSIRSNGMKTVLRFAYTKTDTVDASLTQIQSHMDQLAPYLAANKDVIMGMQCGWVGQWGEFQGSTNFGSDSWPPNLSTANRNLRKAVVDKALAVMPSDRWVQVRQPWIKMYNTGNTPATASDRDSANAVGRVGHFNDCFLSGSTDAGTYWQQTSEEAFLSADTKYVPMGGETCTYNEPRSSGATALSEMARFHWTFCNAGYNESVILSWKNSGHYAIFNKRLGYRLSLTTGTYPTTGTKGSAITVNFKITNDGFAAPTSQRTVKLVLRNTSTNAVTVVSLAADLRNWLPGTTATVNEAVTIPASIASGTYRLLLWLPDPASGLASRPEYAIQLLNTGTWETATGYNDLGHTITIS
jgi:hypothetical protein